MTLHRAAPLAAALAIAVGACADRYDGRSAPADCAGFPIQAAIANARPGSDRCERMRAEKHGMSVDQEMMAMRWTGYQRSLETPDATLSLAYVTMGDRTFLKQVGFDEALAAFAPDIVKRGRPVSAVASAAVAERLYEYRLYDHDGERCAGFVSHGAYKHIGRDSRAMGLACAAGGAEAELGPAQLRQLLALLKFGDVGPDPVPAPFLLGSGRLARRGLQRTAQMGEHSPSESMEQR